MWDRDQTNLVPHISIRYREKLDSGDHRNETMLTEFQYICQEKNELLFLFLKAPAPTQKSWFSSKNWILSFLQGGIAFAVYFRKHYGLLNFWSFYRDFMGDAWDSKSEFFENYIDTFLLD
jgi:hypothetical protein